MLTFLPWRSTSTPCRWCGSGPNEWTYQIAVDDAEGYSCLPCLLLVHYEPAQGVDFRDHSEPWGEALLRQLAEVVFPKDDPAAALWVRRVFALAKAWHRRPGVSVS